MRCSRSNFEPKSAFTTLTLGLSLAFGSFACSDTDSPQSTGTGTAPGQTTAGTTASGAGNGSTGTTDGTNTGPSTPASCNRSVPPATVAETNITKDTVWSGVVSLESDVRVYQNATLTIQPGTTIIAKPGASLDIGWSSGAAGIMAQGTAAQPIHFCGENSNPGVWQGVQIQSNTVRTSVIKHVVIENAGAYDRAALELYSPIRLEHLHLLNSDGLGLLADDFHPESAHLNISKSGVPARLLAPAAVTHFPEPSSLTGNQNDRVELKYSRIESELNMRNLGVPYLQLESVHMSKAAKWTMAPGIKYDVVAGADVDIGWAGEAATIQWSGTQDQPIEFRAQSASPGGWGKMEIQEKTTPNSTMQHVLIRHATDPVEISSPIKINQVSIEDALAGISIASSGLAVGSSNLSVRRVKAHPVTAHTHALYSLPQGGEFTDNEKNTILVTGTNLNESGSIRKMPIPYLVESTMYVSEGAQITISAGAEFVMSSDTEIDFGWAGSDAGVTMVGTQSEPIVFRGQSALPGYWKGLKFGEKVRTNSKLAHVNIAHGGSGDQGLLELEMSLDVQNCHLHDSSGWGIRKKPSDTRDYQSSNQFSNNAKGDIGEM